MFALRNKMETPPGGWRFPRPDGSLITGGDVFDLAKKVSDYRIINNIPLGDPESEIQDFLCRQNPHPPCGPANRPQPKPGVKAKGVMVARFLNAMAQWMVHGGHVEQEEAERRAEICAGCPWNTFLDDAACFGCFGLTEKVMKIIGNRKTRMDDSLRFCGLCGCSNAVSAFVPMDILARAHKLDEFPADVGGGVPCWKRAYADQNK